MKPIIYTFCAIALLSCNRKSDSEASNYEWRSLEVTATAYNSVSWQTSDQPNITAWGDTLEPGIKAIAVSRDLIPLGLNHNTPVHIQGLEGTYLVKDKMHWRWRKKIDIFMGKNIDSARNWGRKKICIDYGIKVDRED